MDTILDIPVGVSSLAKSIEATRDCLDRKAAQRVFACANSHSMNVATRDDEFRSALLDADLVVADGVGVLFVAKLFGKDVGAHIIGQEYFQNVMDMLEKRGRGRVFFFGSSQATLDGIRERFRSDFPALTLCGTISPPFGEWTAEENREFVDKINHARPDVLWVGMTAPKQEKWVFRNRSALNVPVIGSIGAVFDFYAGTVKASPKWVRALRCEAAYRLVREPRRLWRRILVSNVTFIFKGVLHELSVRSAR